MAESVIAGINLSGAGEGIMNFALLMAGILILVVFIVGIFLWMRQKKKYAEYKIIIKQLDNNGNVIETWDDGGVFVDKVTQHKRLWLKKGKVGLNCNNVPYTIAITPKRKVLKMVYLLRTGEKNYKFIHEKIDTDTIQYTVGEEDVNWAVTEYEKVKQMTGKNNFLEKYAPYIMFIVSILLFFILVIFILNKTEKILPVLAEVSKNLADAARVIPQTYNGSMVIN